jgi:polysaccharide export outer membrane protein
MVSKQPMVKVRRVLSEVFLLLVSLSMPIFALAAPYMVNPGDLLKIDVWDEKSLSREVLVRPDGLISIPMAGEIDTKNSTPSQVSETISQRLGKYMQAAPPVVVSLVNTNGNKIYVIGKVTEPGEFLINSDTDVMQALALAGGLNPFAAENDILILRRSPDGKQIAIPFRYARVKDGEELESNIILESRDVVVVP